MSAKVDLRGPVDQEHKIPDLLAEVASRCQLAVVSDAFAPDKTVSGPLGQAGEVTVYDILEWMRCQSSARSLSYGEYLIVSADEPRLAQAGERASLERWAQDHHPVAYAFLCEMIGSALAMVSFH